MPNSNPLFKASTELGDELFHSTKDAKKAGAKVTPFGEERVQPADFRRQQDQGG